MNFHPEQRYLALLALNGGRIETWKRVTELEALRKVKLCFPNGVPSVARLALRPVDNRGMILDGFIEFHRTGDRWFRQENHLDKAA